MNDQLGAALKEAQEDLFTKMVRQGISREVALERLENLTVGYPCELERIILIVDLILNTQTWEEVCAHELD